MCAPMSPSAPEPALLLLAAARSAAPPGRRASPAGTARGRAGSRRAGPRATSWRASAIAGHPAVGEADHRRGRRARAARSAAAAIASASATVLASGFSQSTCLPASSAAIAISAWVSPGVQMSTRSMSSRSMTRAPVGLASTPSRAAPAASATAAGVAAARARVSSGRSGRSKKLRRGAPGLGVGGAHEGVADHADAEGGRSGAVMTVLAPGAWRGRPGDGGPVAPAAPASTGRSGLEARGRCTGRRCPW